MRALVLFAVLSLAALGARAETFHAGISRVSVIGDDVLVWYPTDADEVRWDIDTWPIPASHDAPIAAGRFPVVLLAHGGGVTGGKPYILSELSADLARRGYLVIAPFHGVAGLLKRPEQIRQAFEAIITDPRIGPHADPARLGMIGFSLGGAVTLALAGARWDFAHLDAYCDAHPDDVMSCDHAPGGGKRNAAVPWWAFWASGPTAPKPLPLKAIVLLDPFAAMFPRDHLTAVTMPVLILRPDRSELPGEENAAGLASSLPRRPQFEIVPGGHFIFVDVCPPEALVKAPGACRDAPGVDRASAHAAMQALIAKFFGDNL